jgi:hypothetical protein
MVEQGTLCVNADVVKKAGLYANTTAAAEAATNVYIKEAEGFLSAMTRYDWVTNYASISAIGKEILRDAVSSHAAIAVINFDMGGFTSRTEAQTMIDVNYTKVVDCINILNDDKGRSFTIKGSV